MKTLERIPNTSNLVALKARANEWPEYDVFSMLIAHLEPDYEILSGKQEFDLNDWLTVYKTIFTVASRAIDGAKDMQEIKLILFNSIRFGMIKLHDTCPRVANMFIDTICDPYHLRQLDPKDESIILIKCGLLANMHKPFLFVFMSILLSQHSIFYDMPEPDDASLRNANIMRQLFLFAVSTQ